MATGVPIFVKLAPDLENEALDALVRVAQEKILRPNRNEYNDRSQGYCRCGPGRSLWTPFSGTKPEVVDYLTQRIDKPVIAVGGISSVEDAMAMFERGASAIQIIRLLSFKARTHRCNQQSCVERNESSRGQYIR